MAFSLSKHPSPIASKMEEHSLRGELLDSDGKSAGRRHGVGALPRCWMPPWCGGAVTVLDVAMVWGCCHGAGHCHGAGCHHSAGHRHTVHFSCDQGEKLRAKHADHLRGWGTMTCVCCLVCHRCLHQDITLLLTFYSFG